MCGLFAIIGNLENKDSKYVSNLAKEALLLSSLRGCEGFGICLDFNNLNDVIQMKQNLKTKDILSNVTKEIVNSLSKKKNLTGPYSCSLVEDFLALVNFRTGCSKPSLMISNETENPK